MGTVESTSNIEPSTVLIKFVIFIIESESVIQQKQQRINENNLQKLLKIGHKQSNLKNLLTSSNQISNYIPLQSQLFTNQIETLGIQTAAIYLGHVINSIS